MKNFWLITLLISCFSSFASHIAGGSITWEKGANSNYTFKLTLYRECSSISAPLSSTMNITGPQGPIQVLRQSFTSIAPECTGTGKIYCNTPVTGAGAVEVHEYKSAPVMLTGQPPASGWDFVFNLCCRPGGIVNLSNGTGQGYYLKSTMYPGQTGSSPFFSNHANQVLTSSSNTYSAMAQSGHQQDSLFYRLVDVYTAAATPAVYAQGYSGANPLPNPQTNVINGPVNIDGHTGLITYDINLAINGIYCLGVEVEQWRNGALMSRVLRDFTVAYANSNGNNSVPDARIDTSSFPHIDQKSTYAYEAILSPGDTLNFVVGATDFDLNSSTSQAQTMSFEAFGSALDTSYSSDGMPNGAKLNPLAPQAGWSHALSNNVYFSWPITSAHLQEAWHTFTFSFQDDECPYPGVQHLTLKVAVRKRTSIAADTLKICLGDSVKLNGYSANGIYQWMPAAGLSDPSAANPMASPSASGYYYLANGQGAQDSVYIQVIKPGTIHLNLASGTLELTDTSHTTIRNWYYNGIPFIYPLDTLSPVGVGDYSVKAIDHPCTLYSDTVTVSSSDLFSIIDQTNGAYNGSMMSYNGSRGFTFMMNKKANIIAVNLIGIEDLHQQSSGYDLSIKIYEAGRVEVFSRDTTLVPPFFGPISIPVSHEVVPNTDYTIAITGDSALTFKYYEGVSYPYNAHQQGLIIKGAYEGLGKNFPVKHSTYLMPVSLQMNLQDVMLQEVKFENVRIFPNPASTHLTLEGLSKESVVQIIDSYGKVVRQIFPDQQTLILERKYLPAGVYGVKVLNKEYAVLHKVVFD